MEKRRRYTKQQKAAAVGLALTVNPLAASEGTGIPRTTILGWIDRPEYDDLRQKTRDEMSDGFKVLANLAMQRLLQQIEDDQVDPKDVAVAMGVATEKYLLLRGEATGRHETRDITHDLDPDTRRRLAAWVDRRVDADPGATDGVPAGDSAGVREPAAG